MLPINPKFIQTVRDHKFMVRNIPNIALNTANVSQWEHSVSTNINIICFCFYLCCIDQVLTLSCPVLEQSAQCAHRLSSGEESFDLKAGDAYPHRKTLPPGPGSGTWGWRSSGDPTQQHCPLSTRHLETHKHPLLKDYKGPVLEYPGKRT